MSPAALIRLLVSPDRERWKPMLLGLGLFAGGVKAAVLLQDWGIVAGVLVLMALAAWIMGACAMVGYVRWLFASELSRAKRERPGGIEREDK
jgi:hypothetical protein